MIKEGAKKFNAILLFILMLFSTIAMTVNVREVNGEILNNYPIILVHGLYGWGKEDIKNLNYWGGKNDLEKSLNDLGFKTMSATVGAVSSNWDRAVELYYYIKGGRVDYGAAHSKECGHERYGKTFKGIYPEWDEVSKVHLIGHSFGGQTIRLLTELLRDGDKTEQDYYESHTSEGISSLFLGSKSWISSITTVATPLNGATYANYINESNFSVKNLFLSAGAIVGLDIFNVKLDLKLEQWGLKRNEEDSIFEYRKRVEESNIWDSNDNALYDLTTDAASKFNENSKTYSDIYYFSYNGNNSTKSILSGYYLPKKLALSSISAIITGRYRSGNKLPFGDKSWWKNDGTVSVISAQYPFGAPHKSDDGIIKKGIWIIYPTMENWGHGDFVGVNSKKNFSDITNFYKKVATNLSNLPK